MTFELRITAAVQYAPVDIGIGRAEITGPFTEAQARSLSAALVEIFAPAIEDLARQVLAAWQAAIPTLTGAMASAVRVHVSVRADPYQQGAAWFPSIVARVDFGLAFDQWSAWNGLVALRPRLRDFPVRQFARDAAIGAIASFIRGR